MHRRLVHLSSVADYRGEAVRAIDLDTNQPIGVPIQSAVTLTVTDNEGCSAALVFTGQTASCNASPGGPRWSR